MGENVRTWSSSEEEEEYSSSDEEEQNEDQWNYLKEQPKAILRIMNY